MGVNEDRLQTIIQAYLMGEKKITFAGNMHSIDRLFEFKIFTHNFELNPKDAYKFAVSKGLSQSGVFREEFLPPKVLEQLGKDVTEQFIGDSGYGEVRKKQKDQVNNKHFVHLDRLKELESIKSTEYDLGRLYRLCEELNDNYKRGNYLSVAMLGRSILDHVPPLFGMKTFNEVANNYGGKSFKKAMQHLNTTMRSIADIYLHETIRVKESLPNENQVNFSQDLDVLLSEIVRMS